MLKKILGSWKQTGVLLKPNNTHKFSPAPRPRERSKRVVCLASDKGKSGVALRQKYDGLYSDASPTAVFFVHSAPKYVTSLLLGFRIRSYHARVSLGGP